MKRFDENSKCEKCGHGGASFHYLPEVTFRGEAKFLDVIGRKCVYCGHTWAEVPLDAPEKLPDLAKHTCDECRRFFFYDGPDMTAWMCGSPERDQETRHAQDAACEKFTPKPVHSCGECRSFVDLGGGKCMAKQHLYVQPSATFPACAMFAPKLHELKPCPHCGQEAVLYHTEGLLCYRCVTCGATSGRREDEFYAMAAWNRRAHP